MTEVTSVSAIVSQITATLSESVSELTLLVVQKKEENAEVSPELPTAVQAVCRAADTLVQVADQLADAEYVEYTAIFSEMKEATAQVSSASSRLFASVQTLNSSTSSNRQDGWQSLSDSCGLIAKKTIRLLEIVYGAEIKRTLTVAANAVRALRDLSDRMEEVEADPQAFADAAGEAAGQVNQVAAYLEEVYQSVATSPEERQRLQALADKLKDQSQAIIDDANKVLEDPSSSSAFADMTRTIESTKTLIDEATRPLQKELNPDSKATAAIVDQLEQQLSALPVLAQNVASSSNAKENDSEGKRTRKEWQNELDRIDDLLRELETANGGNVMAKVGGAEGKEGKEEQEEREKEEMCQRAKAVLVKMRPGIVVNKRDAKSSLSSSKDLLVAAQELADLMAGLIAKNKASAVTGFNKRSDAALELAELLDELDRLSQSNKGKEISVARVNSLLDAVHKVDDVVQGKTNKHKPSSASSSVSATSSSTSSRSSAPSSSTAPASSAPAAATSAPRSAAPRSSAPSAASSSAAPTAAAAVESNNQLVGEIERMAQDLKAQTSNTKMAANDSQDPFVQSYTSISEQLSALARAAKQGKGNELLTTARAIAASLNQLIQAINALAARCTHIPSERERLLKYSAALSNFGVQLKILASVKAASAQPDMDNDSSLVNLTNNIGKALSAALSTLDSVKLRVK